VSRRRNKTAESNPYPADSLSFLKSVPGGVVLAIRVHPGAKKSTWSGCHGKEIKLSIQAPPVEGAANEGCITFLAQWFGLNRSQVQLVKGEKTRSKVFLLKGLPLNECQSLIPIQIQGLPE
jgi:uncharacterized protein (TIGR00251 family)